MNTDKKVNVAILGASGYTGSELIRILSHHPKVNIVALTADKNFGKSIGNLFPSFSNLKLPVLKKINEINFHEKGSLDTIDLVFSALPSGQLQEIISSIPQIIIDLSADFRLENLDIFEEVYGFQHKCPSKQTDAVYGLTELFREKISSSRLIANPGCYPTSILLPLIPLCKEGVIDLEGIIIDSKSGVTGAGRSLKQSSLFAEVSEGVHAYGVGFHRHAPEIEQALVGAANNDVKITFTPHLVPMNRGILSTIYLSSDNGANKIRTFLKEYYSNDFFVNILDKGNFPRTSDVRGTNNCFISVTQDKISGKIIICSVIDNLVKGASGQAVQNMNLIYGFNDNLGLKSLSIFP